MAQGVISIESIQPIEKGWDKAEIEQLLGPPFAIQSPSEAAGPTQAFAELGFTLFDFTSDRDLDEVWVYKHDRRGKFKLKRPMFSFIGIKDGFSTGVWQQR